MLLLPNEKNKLKIDNLITEIRHFKRETAKSLIEIGKRLIEIKELLPHGNWGKWVEENVEFSQNTAGQFMRIAKEFSNSGSVKNFSTRQLYLLLEIPQEEREEFIQQPHFLPSGESKTVQDMTTRELQLVIRDLREKAKEAQSNVDDLIAEVQRLNTQLTKQLPPQTIEVVREVIPKDYEELKAQVKEQQTKICHLTRDQLLTKDKQKVITDANLLVQELAKRTKKLKLEYDQVGGLDQEVDRQIEFVAKACARTAKELSLLIHTKKTHKLN